MNSEQIDTILKTMPNSRKAKNGVIIDTESGIFHMTDIFSMSEYEGLGHDATFFAPFCSIDDIKKINNPLTSADFLLKLRAEAIVDNPRLIRVFKKRKGNKKNWSLEEYYKSRTRENIYITSLSKGNQERLKGIPAGSAYINNVNAMCMKSKAGNIILVSEPMEYFLYFMNIFFYGDDFEISEKDVNSSFIIAQRIMAGHESLDFDLDPRGVLPDSVEAWMRNLTDIQYQFILGHEYSHHLLGHLSDSKLSAESLSNFISMYNGTEKISHYKYSHKLEYDADWYAIKNVKGNSSFKECIANAAFLSLMYLETGRRIKNYVNPPRRGHQSSHPDPEKRIYKIRTKLNNKYGFTREQLENNLGYLQKYTDRFIQEYLVYNFDAFEQYGSIYLPSYKPIMLIDRVDF